jgi:hypothetical protein
MTLTVPTTATHSAHSPAPDVAPPQTQEFVGECRSSRVGMSDAREALKPVEGDDPCYFCAMGELARKRLEQGSAD